MAITVCDALAQEIEVVGADGLSAAHREHAARCPHCGPLVAFDAGLARVTAGALTDAPEPGAALRAALAADARPVPPFSAARRLLAPVGVGLAFAVAILALVPRRDLAEQPPVPFWASAALWAALCAAGLWATLYRGRLGLGLRSGARWLLVGATVVLFEAGAWMLTRSMPSSLHLQGSRATGVHMVCATFGSAMAACVGAVAFRAARRSAAVSPSAAGAAAGAAAGIVAALSLQLECAFADPFHVGIAHGVPVVLGATVGALLGRRVLSP